MMGFNETKGLKQADQFGGGDADSGVLHRQIHPLGIGDGGNMDFSTRGIFHRVSQTVRQAFQQQLVVAAQGKSVGNIRRNRQTLGLRLGAD